MLKTSLGRFRTIALLEYYTPRLEGPPVRYLGRAARWGDGPEWFLLHSQDRSFRPEPEIEVRGVRYRLARPFPYARLSGWAWYVYHRQDSQGFLPPRVRTGVK